MPGSIPFLLVGLVVALLLIRLRAARRLGTILLIALVAGYWLLSTTAVASLMAFGLSHGYRPLESRDQAEDATAVVVLGAGNFAVRGRRQVLGLLTPPSASRVLEAARVYDLLGNRPWLIASGGPTVPRDSGPSEAASMRALLVRLGVPSDRVLLEERSRTTHEEALDVLPILRAHDIRRFVLVTSPTHMLRSMGAFRAEGLDPVPAIAAAGYDRVPVIGWVVPTTDGLDLGQMALHEYLGLVYYGLRGWLRF